MTQTVLEYASQPDGPPAAFGRVLELSDGHLVLGLPGSDYRLHLVLEIPLHAEVGDRVQGSIHAAARRVDIVKAGGRFVEPVYGRPRRVQGRVIGGHPPSRLLYVKAAVPFICVLTDERQEVGDFAIGQLASFDVEPGSVFKPFPA